MFMFRAAGGGHLPVVRWLVEQLAVDPETAVTKGRHDGKVY